MCLVICKFLKQTQKQRCAVRSQANVCLISKSSKKWIISGLQASINNKKNNLKLNLKMIFKLYNMKEDLASSNRTSPIITISYHQRSIIRTMSTTPKPNSPVAAIYQSSTLTATLNWFLTLCPWTIHHQYQHLVHPRLVSLQACHVCHHSMDSQNKAYSCPLRNCQTPRISTSTMPWNRTSTNSKRTF